MKPNPWKQAWQEFRLGFTFMLLEWALRCAPAPFNTELAVALSSLGAKAGAQ